MLTSSSTEAACTDISKSSHIVPCLWPYREEHGSSAKLPHERDPEKVTESEHEDTERHDERCILRRHVEFFDKAHQSRHETVGVNIGEKGKKADAEESSYLHTLVPVLTYVSVCVETMTMCRGWLTNGSSGSSEGTGTRSISLKLLCSLTSFSDNLTVPLSSTGSVASSTCFMLSCKGEETSLCSERLAMVTGILQCV